MIELHQERVKLAVVILIFKNMKHVTLSEEQEVYKKNKFLFTDEIHYSNVVQKYNVNLVQKQFDRLFREESET